MSRRDRALLVLALLAASCAGGGVDDERAQTSGLAGAAGSVAAGQAGAGTAGSLEGGVGGSVPGGAAGSGGSGPPGPTMRPCGASFHWTGTSKDVKVAGEWDGFDLGKAQAMTQDGKGGLSLSLPLPPGTHAYKLVVDGTWTLDPAAGRRKYVAGVENSAIQVGDCARAGLLVESFEVARPAPGAGHVAAKLRWLVPKGAAGVGTVTVEGPASASVDPTSGEVTLTASGLADGKYGVRVTPVALDGAKGDDLLLPFWVEAERFDWRDALIYMAVTDRYRDGDTSNDPAKVPGVDPRGDFQGGDLQGLAAAIDDGTLDALGVRALWLTPFQTNPSGAYPASDGVHMVTGYHGYWPTKARAVDARIGGEQALHQLVERAHAHGIRVLMDFVVNHVHEDHEYVKQHPDWFRTGCVCGTAGCDWTEHALDCMFAPYLPDVDHTVFQATEAWVDDAAYWLETFDLDGLRVDAVKHVEEAATRNLAARVRERFEQAGTRYFLMGETAMGWSDCADPCNDENYGTISRYIGPFGLDGQFDFVLYHGVSYRTFAEEQKGFLHADYWTKHGLEKYPKDAVMTPYIGSHDTARFVTLADPKQQSAAGNQWEGVAGPTVDLLPHERARLALAWLLALPGAPLLYYGDEYGESGGVDPNNRVMHRTSLSSLEGATLSLTKKLGQARRDVPALRRGGYSTLYATDDVLVFGRPWAGGPGAIVGLNRTGQAFAVEVDVTGLFSAGDAVVDRLSGEPMTVGAGGKLTLTLPARGSVVVAK